MASLPSTPPIPGIVAIEFLVGSRNRLELERSRRFIDSLDVCWHTPRDNELAYRLVTQYRLSTGIGLSDYLIAAQAINLGATLYTFNLRHFGAINGLDVRPPYQR